MRDDFGQLARLDAIVERAAEIVVHRQAEIARDQRRDRDDAAVAWAETGTIPDLPIEALLRVFLERRRNSAHVLGQ
jgi:hypothetical protein